MKIYVPTTEYSCYVIQDKDTIRAYHSTPATDTTVDYTDYFIHSDYYEKEGTQTFSRYSSNLPSCLDSSSLTTSIYYRVDFTNILVVFLLLCIVCFGVPLKIFLRFFKRFR